MTSKPDYFNFFIFGAGKSGSTLLSALLSEHPEIGVLNDSFILDRYAQMLLSTMVDSMTEGQSDMASMAEFSAFPVKVNLPPHPPKGICSRSYRVFSCINSQI